LARVPIESLNSWYRFSYTMHSRKITAQTPTDNILLKHSPIQNLQHGHTHPAAFGEKGRRKERRRKGTKRKGKGEKNGPRQKMQGKVTETGKRSARGGKGSGEDKTGRKERRKREHRTGENTGSHILASSFL